MKVIYLDFDDTLVHYGDYMFKDINKQLIEDKVFNEVKFDKFHVSKVVIKEFMSIGTDSNTRLIEDMLGEINGHFDIPQDKLITLDNMNKRHQKMKAFFREFPEKEQDIVGKINNFFIDKKSYKQVSLKNVSKMEEELTDFYKDSKMGYYHNAKPFPKMMDFLNKLKSEGYSIEIVTSSMSDNQRDWKTEWIREHLGELVSDIKYANQKYKHTTGGVFVDDKVKHVEKHNENSEHKGILFSPHNLTAEVDSGVEVCKNYDEVLSVLGIVEKKKTKGREI